MVFEERRVWPPRLVDYFNHMQWQPGQLVGWRRRSAGVRYLIRPLGYPERDNDTEAQWIDARRVRPRKPSTSVVAADDDGT